MPRGSREEAAGEATPTSARKGGAQAPGWPSAATPGSAWGPGYGPLLSLSFVCRKTEGPHYPRFWPGVGTWPRQAREQTPERPPPPPRPLTEQTDAQPGQALPEPLAQALRELPPPLVLPVVVLLVQRQPVHVPGQARGQVGDGREGT